jgi:hypothetical protein
MFPTCTPTRPITTSGPASATRPRWSRPATTTTASSPAHSFKFAAALQAGHGAGRRGAGAGPDPHRDPRRARRRQADRQADRGPLVEPVEHGVVPLDAVVGFQHPVVLVREVQELAGDAAALQGGEGGRAPAVSTTRKSSAPWMTSIGVFHLSTCRPGCAWRSPPGCPRACRRAPTRGTTAPRS